MRVPDISVVMATHNPGSIVQKCLESLQQQLLFSKAELIVADCPTDGTDEIIRTQFPGVKLLHFPRPMGLPELIREAMRRAQGRVVAVTEPYCLFPRDWMSKLLQAHESDFAVIGGAVENGRPNGLVNWACYFSDYGAFMLPAQRQATDVLAGNHVSYKRGVIEEARDSIKDGYYKTFFHWDLERRGVSFLFNPALVLYYARSNTFGKFCRRYFQHGWFFAALRSRRMSAAARFLRLVTIPALPPLLLYRRLQAAFGKKRNRAKLLLSIPLLLVFVTVWTGGEWMGYLLARSPREVYR